MASPRRRLPPLGETSSSLISQRDALRRQKPPTFKQTTTSLPTINKSCTSRRRRPYTVYQPTKLVARRYKSAVLKWLAVNRRKNKRGKEPWPATWPMLRWHDRVRYVHFVQPLGVAIGRRVQGKKSSEDVAPCLHQRTVKLERRGPNPYIRIGGGFRQGYIVDPASVEVQEDVGSVEVLEGCKRETTVPECETIIVKSQSSQSIDASEVNGNGSCGDESVSLKQSKKKKRQWGRNKAGERALVAVEGTDLSGVEEVDDERQLGRVVEVHNSDDDDSQLSSDGSDAVQSKDGSAVNVESGSDEKHKRRGSRHQKTRSYRDDESGNDEKHKRRGSRHQKTRSYRDDEDEDNVMYATSKSRRKKSMADADRRASGGDSSGDVKTGLEKRKKRVKNRRGERYKDVELDDDDEGGTERRGSLKRRRRKTKHGEKSIQSSLPGEDGSDPDDRIDNVSDGEKSASVDDDVSVQTSRKPSSVSVATEDGNMSSATYKVRGTGREKRRLLLADPPVNKVCNERIANEDAIEHIPDMLEHHEAGRRTDNNDSSAVEVVEKRSRPGSANSNNQFDTDHDNAGQVSASESELSVFSRGASGQLQPLDGQKRIGYLGSCKRSKGTLKSNMSQASREATECAGSVIGGYDRKESVTEGACDVSRKPSLNRRPQRTTYGSDCSNSDRESSRSPVLPPHGPSPKATQLLTPATQSTLTPTASENFLEPVATPRKIELKRKRSFQKGQEERGLAIEADSTDSDGDVLEERRKERKRRLSKKHNVQDSLKVDGSEQQPDEQQSVSGTLHAPATPHTSNSVRRKSHPGRDNRINRDAQRRSSHEETSASIETGDVKSTRSGISTYSGNSGHLGVLTHTCASARQRRMGIDYSTFLGIQSTVLDTVPSSEDIKSSRPQSSGISSDVSAVHIPTVEKLTNLSDQRMQTKYTETVEFDSNMGAVPIPGLPCHPPLDAEYGNVVHGRETFGVVRSAVKAPISRAPSDEGDVDDDDEEDDDDTMPRDSQSSRSGVYIDQRSMPSTTVFHYSRKTQLPAEGLPANESAEYTSYARPPYCQDIDSDSGGRSTSASESVFDSCTEDMKSSVIVSHAGRHVSGSVSTVVSQRGLKKRHTRFGYDRNTVGLESTAQVAVPPTGFSDVANVALPHCAATPQLHSKGGEETDETAEVFEDDSSSHSRTSIASEAEGESELQTPAGERKATSVSSADRHESSDSSSQSLGGSRKTKTIVSHASQKKLLSAHIEQDSRITKNLLPTSTNISAVRDAIDQKDAMGLNAGDIALSTHVPTRGFPNIKPSKYRLSSHSGSRELNSDGENSKSGEDDRSVNGGVGVQPSEETTELGDEDVHDAEPLPRKPWETLNVRGAQQRSRVQIQIRADKVLRRAQVESANGKRSDRNGAAIEFLSQYHLVDRSKLGAYARAFAAEEENESGMITFQQLLLALETIPSTSNMSRSHLDYVFRVLDLEHAQINFRLFAVVVSLCERLSAIASEAKAALDGLDMIAVEKKLDFYMRLFRGSNEDSNDYESRSVYGRFQSSVKTSLLRIELKAGGLSRPMEEQVIRRCDPSGKGKVLFLDYVAYIPLFIYMHERICDNPLSMATLGPGDMPEDILSPEPIVDKGKHGSLESVSLPPVHFRHGSGSSVASSFMGGSLLLKQARALLARQTSLAQSRTQLAQTHSLTVLPPATNKVVQEISLPPIMVVNTKSQSKELSPGLSDVSAGKDIRKSQAPSWTSSVTGRGGGRKERKNRPPSSSSDSSRVSGELRRGKKTSTSSIHSSFRHSRTTAERIYMMTRRVTCETPESEILSSAGDPCSRSNSPSVQSSRPQSSVLLQRPEVTIEMLSAVNGTAEAMPYGEHEQETVVVHPPLGRLAVPLIPAGGKRLGARSPDDMSPAPFTGTSSSNRTSSSNSLYSSKQPSLVQGMSRY